MDINAALSLFLWYHLDLGLHGKDDTGVIDLLNNLVPHIAA